MSAVDLSTSQGVSSFIITEMTGYFTIASSSSKDGISFNKDKNQLEVTKSTSKINFGIKASRIKSHVFFLDTINLVEKPSQNLTVEDAIFVDIRFSTTFSPKSNVNLNIEERHSLASMPLRSDYELSIGRPAIDINNVI